MIWHENGKINMRNQTVQFYIVVSEVSFFVGNPVKEIKM